MRCHRPFVAMAALALALPLLLPAFALAQPTPAEPAAPGGQAAPPEKIEPERPIGEPRAGESLGEHLDRTDGVIQPPKGVDPGLVEPPPVPPAALPTPVSPPPGTPQNQPNVQPQ